MQYKGITAHIKYDDRKQTFIGRTLELCDVLEFEGSSVSQLKASFSDRVDGYMEQCQREGKPYRKTFSGRLAIRVEPMIHEKIAQCAALENISINQWVERALEEAIKGDQHG